MIGQVTTELDRGLALSCAREVEEGARAALILVEGLFRLDVTPREDTLKLQVRNLTDGPLDWSEGDRPLILAAEPATMSAHTLEITVAGRRAKLILSSTRHPDRGVMHVAAQATVSS